MLGRHPQGRSWAQGRKFPCPVGSCAINFPSQLQTISLLKWCFVTLLLVKCLFTYSREFLLKDNHVSSQDINLKKTTVHREGNAWLLVIHRRAFGTHGNHLIERMSLTFIKLSNFTYKQMKFSHKPRISCLPIKKGCY